VLTHIRAGVAFNLPSILDLVRAVVIEAAFIAVVVAIDIAADGGAAPGEQRAKELH
jgi:hypothetical protein